MKMFKTVLQSAGICCLLLSASGSVWAGDAAPVYFAAGPGALAQTKARLAARDESLQPALQALIRAADRALDADPPSVVEKANTPPSGDRHDYMSVAPYFWPDPAKSNGLPYLRHDGKVNPESRDDAFDHGRLGTMARNVETLALAYYFTGREAYAAKAANFLRVWFLAPATRMNPNLQFAQAVPGVNTGRGIGILEGQAVSRAADAAGLLAGSAAWTANDRQEFKTWLEMYFHWLLTSSHGKDEANARNNHGSWYDVQAVELALVLDQPEVARQICTTAKQKRLATQIELDGRQPQELARTAAFSYSCYNLDALFTLATLAEHTGVDLWHCRLANGKYALAAALDFLIPYTTVPAKPWPYEQIKKFDRTAIAPELHQAAVVYPDSNYEKVLAGFSGLTAERFQLLCPSIKKSDDGAVPR